MLKGSGLHPHLHELLAQLGLDLKCYKQSGVGPGRRSHQAPTVEGERVQPCGRQQSLPRRRGMEDELQAEEGEGEMNQREYRQCLEMLGRAIPQS